MKYVLLTGGSGLVGLNVGEVLRAKGYGVFDCNRRVLGSKGEIVGDISEEGWSKKAIRALQGKQVYAVVHLAGQPTVWRSVKQPRLDLEYNAVSTLNILEVMNALSIPRLLYSSSEAVYGDIAYPNETTEHKPINPYGISKSAAERYIEFFSRTYKYNYTIVRPSFVIGNGLERNVVFDILNGILSKKTSLNLKISIASKFNFVDVSCVAKTIVHLLSNEVNLNQLNIVGREDITLSRIIELFENFSGRKIKIINESKNCRIACLKSRHMDLYDQYQVSFENSLKNVILTSKEVC